MLFGLSCFFVVVSQFFYLPFFTFHSLIGHNKCNVDGKWARCNDAYHMITMRTT